MMEQQSRKSGMRSEAQKTDRARDGYAPIPPSNPVGGAFGEHKKDTPTDQETAVDLANKKSQTDE